MCIRTCSVYYVHTSRRALQSIARLNKQVKNEVGCRDDTVPKPVDTRRHCEEE